MISVDEALEHIGKVARTLPVRRVDLLEACGLRLAETIASKVDSPPFDKSMLDGYAILVHDPARSLRVVEQVVAGGVPHHAVEPGTTIRLMTGAPVPDGADAVIKHEDVQEIDSRTIILPDAQISAGAGLNRRGSAFRTGQNVLEAGRKLQPIDIALLAEIGQAKVPVTPRPRVAVLPTGDELVDCSRPVGPGQICNSNGPMLLASLAAMGLEPIDLGIVGDDAKQLKEHIERGLASDMLLITGGVSAGVLDLVPDVLQQLGVEQIFHKVRMKPGKPLWFGIKETEQRQTLVFGLPGNPVSTLVSLELFVKPALCVLAGETFAPPRSVQGVLSSEIGHRGQRTVYHPCRIHFGQREQRLPSVEPLPWRGSADLAAMTRANALAILRAGDYKLGTGDEVPVIPLGTS